MTKKQLKSKIKTLVRQISFLETFQAAWIEAGEPEDEKHPLVGVWLNWCSTEGLGDFAIEKTCPELIEYLQDEQYDCRVLLHRRDPILFVMDEEYTTIDAFNGAEFLRDAVRWMNDRSEHENLNQTPKQLLTAFAKVILGRTREQG